MHHEDLHSGTIETFPQWGHVLVKNEVQHWSFYSVGIYASISNTGSISAIGTMNSYSAHCTVTPIVFPPAPDRIHKQLKRAAGASQPARLHDTLMFLFFYSSGGLARIIASPDHLGLQSRLGGNIGVAHFRQNVLWMTGILNPLRTPVPFWGQTTYS